jgi:prepilin-type N-terminal cleavage/methylation domain-containing protein
MTTAAHPSPRAGFTVIELLVVMSILAILAAMVMPMLAVMRNQTMKARSEFVLRKVDTCLRLYKTDWNVYPYQAAYPDLAAGQTFANAPNHLAYHLGADIAQADRAALMANLQTAASKFVYNGDPTAGSEGAQPAPGLNFTNTCVSQANDANPNIVPGPVSVLLNRMGADRAAQAVLAGDLTMKGSVISDAAETRKVDYSALAVLAPAEIQPEAAGIDPGMATNYLQGDLDAHYLKGDTIVDAWGNPLVYICQLVPGARATPIWVGGSGYAWYTSYSQAGCFDPRMYGLGPTGFDAGTGPQAGLVSANRTWLLYGGRIRLSQTDAGDGQATPADVAFLPTASDLMHSDARYYAAPGFETEFELWSAGRDGNFAWMRDDTANLDNLAAQKYNRVLANE